MGRVDQKRAERLRETADRMHITRDKSGKVIDTIPTYVLKRYIGGALDGEEIVGRDLGKKRVSFGAEEGLTYVRKSKVLGPIRIVAFVEEFYPKVNYWPYEVWRRLAKGHPELMQITKKEVGGNE